KYLGTDHEHAGDDGQLTVGCYTKDSEESNELIAWCGAERKVKKAKVEQFEGSLSQIEEAQAKKNQSFTGLNGEVITFQGDKQELKDARKKGTLNEALLNRRSKVKADRYCK
ncbi:hypothetical protein SARC_12585, partial [Sphaeroforma arctica JP610]